MVKANGPSVTIDEQGRQIIHSDRKTISEGCFKLNGKPFSLEGYKPFEAIYQSTSSHVVLMAGRQVAKSSTAANFITAECIGEADWNAIAVLPSIMQMRRFSNQRVGKVISTSELVKKWFMNTSCKRNTYERSFANDSTMFFGALSQLESLRGLSGNRMFEDEVQDMILEELDIVEEAMSGQRSDRKFIMRAGTPKTVGNILEETFRDSTACEWIVKCPSGHHNLPDVDNIHPSGFICKACKSVCDVRDGYWMAQNALDKKWLGFRLPQIIFPLHTEDPKNWEDLVHKRNTMESARFMNEVMGQSAGSGIEFLTEDDLRACCEPGVDFAAYLDPRGEKYSLIMATIDWGLTARKSYTILSIWGVTQNGRIKLLFAYRFMHNDLTLQIQQIATYVKTWNVRLIGADWGAGVVQGINLEQMVGQRVHKFMYVSEQSNVAVYDKESHLYKINRTQCMSEAFLSMKQKRFLFPDWNIFKQFSPDILSIFMEPLDDRNMNDKFKYSHPENKPDDFAHTCTYAQVLLYLLRERKLFI